MQKITILLTACINPQGMSYTALNNPATRLQQYIEAINFYIKETSTNIVVVENTDYDLGKHFDYSDRLEFLFFQGNNFDKKLGKGYGEGMIVEYALQHSKLLQNTEAICKITGRNTVVDIAKRLQRYAMLSEKVIANIDFKRKFVSAKCICCPTLFWKDYFLINRKMIDDSKHSYFENVLYYSLQNWIKGGHRLCVIIRPIPIKGISGTSAKELSISFSDYLKSVCSSVLLNLYYKCFNRL